MNHESHEGSRRARRTANHKIAKRTKKFDFFVIRLVGCRGAIDAEPNLRELRSLRAFVAKGRRWPWRSASPLRSTWPPSRAREGARGSSDHAPVRSGGTGGLCSCLGRRSLLGWDRDGQGQGDEKRMPCDVHRHSCLFDTNW